MAPRFEHDPLPIPGPLSARKLSKLFGRNSTPKQPRWWKRSATVRLGSTRPSRWIAALAVTGAAVALLAVVLAGAEIIGDGGGNLGSRTSANPNEPTEPRTLATPAVTAKKKNKKKKTFLPMRRKLPLKGVAGVASLGRHPSGNARLRVAVTVPRSRWQVWLSDGPGRDAKQIGSGMPGTGTIATSAMSFGSVLNYKFVDVYAIRRKRHKIATRVVLRIKTAELLKLL